MKLRCLAVDDEPLALGLVAGFIEKTPFLELADQLDNAIAALGTIQKESIDLIFLDIQMADLSGMELAKILESRESKPLIVFTTAFDEFALEGFKVDAIDYLLKPFNYQEFLRAATKAQTLRKLQMQGTKGNDLTKDDFIFLKSEYQLVRVMFSDILYIEGLKDYVKVHVANAPHPILSLTSLKALEEKLPANRFIRIHRSYIVSIEKIKAITKTSVEIEGTHLTISDNYRKAFHDQVKTGL